MPVSYTHLDVYKRQGPLTVLLQSRLLQGQLAVVAGHAKTQQAVILHGLLKALIRHLQQIGAVDHPLHDFIVPVSYTHLDVYKRQGFKKAMEDNRLLRLGMTCYDGKLTLKETALKQNREWTDADRCV